MYTQEHCKKYAGWSIILVLAMVLALTNASSEAHKKALFSGGYYDAPVLGDFFRNIDTMAYSVEYKSYVFFSVLRNREKAEKGLFTIGILGNIILSDGDDGFTIKK